METALKFIQKMIFYTNINYKIMSKVYFIILIFFFGWLPSELYAQNVMPPNDCYLNIDSTGSSMMVKLPDTL